ncbi:MAG TPA: amino acid adenylation domain-containing protein [Thermoanaerobaculia bacterium]|nr:amino acid adenylation domain-containing protein [Thermoanaerobaculia bacterium]
MTIERSRIAVFDDAQKAERDYWVQRTVDLPSLPPSLHLDGERPVSRGAELGQVPIVFSGPVHADLDKVTRGSQFLLYTTLLAALKVCLRGTDPGEQIVAVGSPARLKDGATPAKANALAIVDRLSPEQTFRQLLVAVRTSLIEAYDRQDYPYTRLLRDLDVAQVRNRCPLFDVALCFAGVHGELPDVGNDLTLRLHQEPARIAGVVEFRRDLFSHASVQSLVEHFVTVAQSAVADLDRSLAELSLLSPAERHQLLREWNTGAPPAGGGRSVLELLSDRAEAAPNTTALETGEIAISYGELMRRVDAQARRLHRLGVGPEVLVGIYADRSPDTLVALLAVLRSGGAYLPLDPSWPAERLALVLEDAAPALVLAQTTLADRLPSAARRAPLSSAEKEGSGALEPASGLPLSRLAYVIYTSGSTGRPKGVAVSHLGLANLALSQADAFGLGPDTRVLQFAVLSFDASVSELFSTLVSGATLCLAESEELASATALTERLRRRQIHVVTLPPSLLALLPPDELPGLRTVVTAGEACPAEVAAAWSPGRRFINAYGPTEATVCAALGEVGADEAGEPPLGRPLAGLAVYLVDSGWAPVPPRQVGDVFLGGIGLARGYRGRPDLTAESFLPDPFGGTPGARLYRSGDRARWLPDGRLSFAGRVDHQVKVRGFRVELPEIESVLRQHSAVQEAVVAAWALGSGRRLVAYFVATPGSSLPVAELRTFLQERLPSFMVPEVFMALSALPRTASGKIDRRALPAPDRSRPELAVRYVEPRTPVETALAGIWAELLDIDQVGLHDSFFELGGNSLLATQVISRARAALGIELDLARMLRSPTLASMARMEQESRGAAPPAAAPQRGKSIDQQLADLELLEEGG